MLNNITEKINKNKFALGLYIRDEFLDKFDEKAYRIINEIKEKGKTASKEQWTQWIKDGKGNKDVQEYIALFPETPEYALHTLLNTGRTYQDTCLDLFKRKKLSDILIGKILTKSNAKTMELLGLRMGIPSEEINPQIINLIANVVIDWLKEDTATPKCDNAYFSALEFTNKETAILELYNSGVEIPETALNKIASNKNLSGYVRNKFFDLGCDFEKITSMTPYMAKIIYESAVDMAIDDGTTSWEINERRRRASCALNRISICEAMEDSMMIDMMNRIYNKDLQPFQSKVLPLTQALNKTNSSYIIEYLYNFASNFEDPVEWKKYLISFDATTDEIKKDIIKDAIEGYYEKFNAVGTAYRSTAMEASDLSFISNRLSEFDLGESVYKKLFDFMEEHDTRKRQLNELRTSFACSPYVPEDLIKRIDKNGVVTGYSDEQMFFARVNNDMRNAGYAHYIIHTTNAYRMGYTNAYEIKTKKELKEIKEIFKLNAEKIRDEKLKESFLNKLDVFDAVVRVIEFNEKMETSPTSKAHKYIHGLHKNCEVYAYIDEFIDVLEKEEKEKTKTEEMER